MTAILFLLILSVLVLIHEAGHYFAARFFGVKAEEFGYGFPPRAIGFVKANGKWKRVSGRDQQIYPNTIWSINWLPLGGFVRLKGEAGESGGQDSFLSQAGWKKFIILAAGVAMNWVFAAIVFTAGFAIGVPADISQLPDNAIVSDRHVEITQVVDGSAAQQAGLKAGDQVRAQNAEEVLNYISHQSAENEEVELTILRNGQSVAIHATPAYIESLGRNGLGVSINTIGTVRFSPPMAFLQGISATYQYTKLIILGFASLVRDLFVQHRVTADVSGPVGIAILTGSVAQQGFWALMQFSAILSINLAVINFLPIPALDGGRALFVVIEGLRRRRTNPRFEAAIHQIGFVALMVLIFIITAEDLHKYGGVIWGGLKGLIGL